MNRFLLSILTGYVALACWQKAGEDYGVAFVSALVVCILGLAAADLSESWRKPG